MTDDFEKRFYDHIEEMREFRGKVLAHFENQDKAQAQREARCANHSARIDAIAFRGKRVEQAIAFSDDPKSVSINTRVQFTEKFVDRCLFAVKAIAILSSAASAVYAGLVFIVRHSDKVIK